MRRKKVAKIKSNGMKTKDMGSVLTWDLVANRPKTISLRQWQILNFLSITPTNIIELDKVINDLLKR